VKLGVLKAVGHNIADSLASGLGFPIGVYSTDIFGEASGSPEGYITVDFLKGSTEGGTPSQSLAEAIRLYRGALARLCEQHSVETSAFRTLSVRFGVDAVYGGHFTVTVEDQSGRQSIEKYVGWPGRRLRARR